MDTHANRGRWFERMLNAACAQYRLDRRAYIFPVPTPVRFGRGRRSAFFERKSSPDYLGVLRGRGVAFDAKSTMRRAWSAPIPDHQLTALQLVSELGHLSGIMLGFWEPSPVAVWVPWPACQQLASGLWSQHRALSLPGAIRVTFTGLMDFLPALEATCARPR
jgi:recombination protein U